MFGSTTDARSEVDVNVNGKSAVDRTETTATKVKDKAEAKKQAAVQKSKEIKDELKADVKTSKEKIGKTKVEGSVEGELKSNSNVKASKQ